MRLFLTLPCPNDKFGGIGEEAARDIYWRICLLPSDDIQDLVTKFRKAVGNREDVVVCATNPDGAIVFQLLATQAKPFQVEFLHLLWALAFVPFPLIHANYFPAL